MDTDLKRTLHDIAEGIRSDVFRAYEAAQILEMMGANASFINNSNFGIFFSIVQSLLMDRTILMLSKLFEKQGKEPYNFPLKNISAALKLIEENQQAFTQMEIKNYQSLMILNMIGYKNNNPNDSITEIFCKYWPNYIGETKQIRIALETLRNKVTAHHEFVDSRVLPNINGFDLVDLLNRVKIFLGFLEVAYLGLESEDNKDNLLILNHSLDATLNLRDLLVKTEIIDAVRGREIINAIFNN